MASIQIYCSYLPKAEEKHKYVKSLGGKLPAEKGTHNSNCSFFYGFASQDQIFNIYFKVWMRTCISYLVGYRLCLFFHPNVCKNKNKNEKQKTKKIQQTFNTCQTIWRIHVQENIKKLVCQFRYTIYFCC